MNLIDVFLDGEFDKQEKISILYSNDHLFEKEEMFFLVINLIILNIIMETYNLK